MQIISNQCKWYKLMTIQAFTKENTGLLDLFQVITIQSINLCNQLLFFFSWKRKIVYCLQAISFLANVSFNDSIANDEA